MSRTSCSSRNSRTDVLDLDEKFWMFSMKFLNTNCSSMESSTKYLMSEASVSCHSNTPPQ